MSLKRFKKLETGLNFKSVTLGEGEGWYDLSVWTEALRKNKVNSVNQQNNK